MTTAEQDVRLWHIACAMKRAHFSDDEISIIVRTAMEFDGIYDLVIMWQEEEDPEERRQTFTFLKKTISDVLRESL